MKLSEQWIREWVNPPLTREALVARLTMAGLEVAACVPEENDFVFEFELTPNRGDCLSVMGIAREIAALTHCPLITPKIVDVRPSTKENFVVYVHAPIDCPRYIGRIVTGFPANIKTPAWLYQKLTRSGIKSISPIVDVMNYVMLELGQPLHAFDLAKIKNELNVRRARPNEQVTLLDGKTLTLNNDVLVIADAEDIQAVAGIMGSAHSAVTENTTAIFIESAFFKPSIIAGKARRYGLHTDASHRFERGVDPALAIMAIERATALLMAIYGDAIAIGQRIDKTTPEFLPTPPMIVLRNQRLETLLGMALSDSDVTQNLQRLQMSVQKQPEGWLVEAPSYRVDIQEEVDLIEEVARMYGYEHLPVKSYVLPLKTCLPSETSVSLSRIKTLLVDQGYHEVITYSFIRESWQKKLFPQETALTLSNPLSAEYAVMRTSLWPGLLETVQYNANRQQNDLRFFETGLRFIDNKQEAVLGGIWAGNAFAAQWSEESREVDFFDIKNDVEKLFALSQRQQCHWQAAAHSVLRPGQTAKIVIDQKQVGWCGALHPELQVSLDILYPVYLFEIHLDALINSKLPVFKPVSKFPSIRRDIALVLDKSITIDQLVATLQKTAGELLIDACVFDIYVGNTIPVGKRSVAIGLAFQAIDRTLQEEEVTTLMTTIIKALEKTFSATLRT